MNGFLSPKEITEKVVEIGKNKSELQILPMLLLGMLAGVYIGFGAELCTMVTHDLSKYLGVGFAKFIGGSVFTVGLMLVVLAGAELFTGNCLMLTGVLAGEVSLSGMLRNWFFVFFANFAGSILLVIIMYYSNLWKVGNLGVGAAALTTAIGKVNLSFSEAFCRGIACNWLVCLAVWLAIAGKDAVSKIFGIYFPIMAFVASGFEHSVANMYFIPMGLFLKGNAAVVSAAGLAEKVNGFTWSAFLIGNLVPVTLGNIVGGAFFVGGVYYFAYLRKNND
jgi:formate/nitrite transporter